VASILFGAGTPDNGELKAYPPMPMRDASQLLRGIAHDEELTAAERSAGMLALVSIPGAVLFNADDTKAWQVLLGGYARQILPPPHHPPWGTTASPKTSTGGPTASSPSPQPSSASCRTTRERGHDAS
jgi:hypothetical protein